VDKVPHGKKLMAALVDNLQNEVEETGAKYVMLQLTAFDDFVASDNLGYHRNEAFWEWIKQDRATFSTFEPLLEGKDQTPFVLSQMHYSANGNRIIGQSLADYLMKNNMLVKKENSKD